MAFCGPLEPGDPTLVAAMVEPRAHPAFRFCLENMRKALPLEFPIYIFHGTKNEAFVRAKSAGIQNVHFFQTGVENFTRYTYSTLCCSVDFYRHFEKFDFMLKFETDSMVNLHSPYDILYFLRLGYDYYGAPWRWHQDVKHASGGVGGNGGLSLRRVRTMIEQLTKHPIDPSLPEGEDLHICSLDLKLPPLEIAKRFSFESIPHPHPWGCHKPWLRYLSVEDWVAFQRYAPAVNTLKDYNK